MTIASSIRTILAALLGALLLSLLPLQVFAQGDGATTTEQPAEEAAEPATAEAPAEAEAGEEAESSADLLTDEQYAALEARIASFDAAMRANNMIEIMGVVPPTVLEKIASTYSVTIEQLTEAMQQQFDQAMQTVTLVDFGMDIEAAQFLETSDGTVYALIPTETVMDVGAAAGGKIKSTSSTLGLLDGETWYLVRVDDAQQVAILKEVYPAFADVEFPAGKMEPVAE